MRLTLFHHHTRVQMCRSSLLRSGLIRKSIAPKVRHLMTTSLSQLELITAKGKAINKERSGVETLHSPTTGTLEKSSVLASCLSSLHAFAEPPGSCSLRMMSNAGSAPPEAAGDSNVSASFEVLTAWT